MNTKNENKPTKSINRFTLAGIALTALVITVLASFAVSGTLAKFIDTVGAQSGAVPAAQFNFNEVYDVETNTFTPIVWNLDQLGATINPSYSSKVFYPGAYGDFSMDVTFISDVPAMAEVTVDFINETGAFLPTVYGQVPDVSLRDLISLNFIAIIKDRGVEPTAEEIDFANDGITVRLGEFEEKLATTLENTIGENGAYYTLGTLIEKTVYVYWKWDFELSTQGNEYDTLFGNYVAKFRDDGIESELGLGVVMIVTQDTLDGSGIVNSLTPQAPNVTANSAGISVTSSTITLPVIAGVEYSSDGVNWQDSNVLTGLSAGTQHTVYVRVKANGIIPASSATSLVLATLAATPSAPTMGSVTVDTVTLNEVNGVVYGISSDGGTNITWQESNIFTGLTASTSYLFYTKTPASGLIPESAPSTGSNITTAVEVWDGSSTAEPATTVIDGKTYYLISNGSDLAWFRDQVNSGNNTINGKLMADVSLNDTTNWQSWTASTTGLNSWIPIGTESAYIAFKGTFDGNGYAVKGIYIKAAINSQGLFGFIWDATVKDLGVEDSFIRGAMYTGGVIGAAYRLSVISNCYNTGNILGLSNHVGGVVGFAYDAIPVSNCYNTGDVSGSGANVGGVAGYLYSGSVIGCYNTGNVISTSNAVGGVVGVNYDNGTVADCYNVGTVSSTKNYVGGVVGQMNYGGVLANSYNTGSVSGANTVGGVVGYATSVLNTAYVRNSYNTGSVSGTTQVGGVVGAGVVASNSYHLSTLGLPGATFTNDASGLETLLTSLNTNRGVYSEWTRDTSGVINNGLPYFVQ